MWKRAWASGFWLLAFWLQAQGQGELILSDPLILSGIEVMVQPMLADSAQNDHLNTQFLPMTEHAFPLGIEAKSAKWITGKLYNHADTSVELFFLSYRFNIQCWQKDTGDSLSGFALAGPDAPLPRGFPLEERHTFRSVIPPGGEYDFRLAVPGESLDSNEFHLFAYDRESLYTKAYQNYFNRKSYLHIYLVSMSILGFQILFALLLWGIIRQVMYLLYALYIIPLALSLHLQYADFIYMPLPFFFSQITLDPIAHNMYFVAFGFYFLFSDRFLQISRNDATGKKLIRVALTSIAFYIPVNFILFLTYQKIASFVWFMSFSMILLVLSIWLIKRVFFKKDTSARLLIIGSLFFILGALSNIISSLSLRILGHALIENFSINFFFFAVPVELLFFSSAIAYKFRQDEIQKTLSSEALVEKMKENELLNAQIQDIRDRIARDLHDDIGATLSSIALYSEVARREGSANNSIKGILEKISAQAREMVGRMSDVVWAIQPRNEGMNALVRKLDDAVATLLVPAEIGWKMMLSDDIVSVSLTIDQKKNIILIFREAINNIAKHSHAGFVTISIYLSDGYFNLDIADNGKGFDQKTIRQGNGLLSMKKRAEECSGILKIDSVEKQGTTFSFRMPINNYGNPV
ncbi:MAG: sensor histidine kinase [Bacteroidia bacterium]